MLSSLFLLLSAAAVSFLCVLLAGTLEAGTAHMIAPPRFLLTQSFRVYLGTTYSRHLKHT